MAAALLMRHDDVAGASCQAGTLALPHSVEGNSALLIQHGDMAGSCQAGTVPFLGSPGLPAGGGPLPCGTDTPVPPPAVGGEPRLRAQQPAGVPSPLTAACMCV